MTALSPSQLRYNEIVSQAQDVLMKKVLAALRDAETTVAAEFSVSGVDEPAPVYEYYASVVHQHMYCIMCGADPVTLKGGDPEMALHVIRNSQNIARHYWGADIKP
jgi:hypothetical protein